MPISKIGTSSIDGLGYGFKNRLINGNMVLDQRNAGASVTIPATVTYVLDRWLGFSGNANRFSIQRNAGSVTPPTGFTNYLGATSLSAYSATSSDAFLINQYIEGFNSADFSFGTASAASVTLSFWIRSSLTGTFSVSFTNTNSTRVYVSNYTVNATNTWEYKTITIPGDTTGTWATDNTTGLQIRFDLGSGSNFQGTAGSWGTSNITRTSGSQSVVGTSGATFYITGVQLEKGSAATSYDVRPYGTELALAQRYYEKSFAIATAPVTNVGIITGEALAAVNATLGNGYATGAFYRVTKRANPTVTLFNRQNSSNNWQWYNSGGTVTNGGVPDTVGENSFCVALVGSTTATVATGHWTASAEL